MKIHYFIFLGILIVSTCKASEDTLKVYCEPSINIENPCYVKIGYTPETGEFNKNGPVVITDERFKKFKIERMQ